MTLLRAMLPAAALFLCLLTGCETDEAKKPAQLPAQANALDVSLRPLNRRSSNGPEPAKTQSPTIAGAGQVVRCRRTLIAQAGKSMPSRRPTIRPATLEAAKANFDLGLQHAALQRPRRPQ